MRRPENKVPGSEDLDRKGTRGKRDDRRRGSTIAKRADRPGRRKAVHDRHLDIHEDEVPSEFVLGGTAYAFERLGTVRCDRNGMIIVDYRSDGEQWTLSVRDDGIGVRTGVFGAKPGLGTGIVDAISQQLGGMVKVTDAHPGTQVLIAHAPG